MLLALRMLRIYINKMDSTKLETLTISNALTGSVSIEVNVAAFKKGVH